MRDFISTVGRSAVAAAFLFFLSLSLPSYGAIDVYTFDDEEKSERFAELMNELRCPKCQNQNLTDSNAGLAKDLKDRAYELILEGQSNDEVVDYLVERYGDFITYRPPLRLGTGLLWFGPLVLFVLVVLGFVIRRRGEGVTLLVDDELDRQRLKEILDDDH
ncbi:MAG: hypothetical protein COB04_03355 [Gammaproteobacteria bacterium]|nr:MAG: hypothetical protein COB04_03355 [Gammaproteobacteria bacterium]